MGTAPREKQKVALLRPVQSSVCSGSRRQRAVKSCHFTKGEHGKAVFVSLCAHVGQLSVAFEEVQASQGHAATPHHVCC